MRISDNERCRLDDEAAKHLVEEWDAIHPNAERAIVLEEGIELKLVGIPIGDNLVAENERLRALLARLAKLPENGSGSWLASGCCYNDYCTYCAHEFEEWNTSKVNHTDDCPIVAAIGVLGW